MRNILIEIEYDGTRFQGWQSQQNKFSNQKASPKTIQEIIEKVLGIILNDKIRLICSGRTDAGVHAKSQIANFKTTSKIPLEKLKIAFNSLLPEDIVIRKMKEVPARFHAQYAAKTKTYRYTILNQPVNNVFMRNYAKYIPKPLHIDLMSEEAKVLSGRHDFKSFQATDKKERNSIRTIKKIKIRKRAGFIFIDIEANGFLYNMARNIVGTLIEIGRGKFPKGSMKKILQAKDRKKAGPTAPAKGLCLLRVKYK